MNLAKQIADHAAKPDRPRSRLAGDFGSFAGGGTPAGAPLQQPQADGTVWWQVGVPAITLDRHPHPIPAGAA